MADARLKAVLPKLADLASRTSYLVDICNNLREPLGVGDLIDIPGVSALTVVDSGASDTAPQTPSQDTISLNANLDPAVFVDLPILSQIQLLGGKWKDSIAEQMIVALKNKMDNDVASYMGELCYDSSATYHDNGASSGATAIPTITLAAVNNCVAALETLEGCRFDRLAWFIHPFAKAAISAVSAFSPIQRSGIDRNFYGVPQIGWLNEVPVYVSQGAKRQRTVASTQWAITGTTTYTITVAAGHNIVPGMVISFYTVTAGGRIASPGLAVTSVTATTIVCTTTGASNASATEAGTITIQACENLLIDTGHAHVAQQLMPTTRIVQAERRTSDVAQVTTVYGRKARVGRVRTLLTTTRAA